MAWLEITINTAAAQIEEIAAKLTAGGFSDLVLEDQAEFETFLEQNREYWDYIDEELQQQLQGLSRIKLYLEDTDAAGLCAAGGGLRGELEGQLSAPARGKAAAGTSLLAGR